MSALYLVLNITKWEQIDAKVMGKSYPIMIPETGIGFMPVYNDLNQAQTDYPDSKIVEVGTEQ